MLCIVCHAMDGGGQAEAGAPSFSQFLYGNILVLFVFVPHVFKHRFPNAE